MIDVSHKCEIPSTEKIILKRLTTQRVPVGVGKGKPVASFFFVLFISLVFLATLNICINHRVSYHLVDCVNIIKINSKRPKRRRLHYIIIPANQPGLSSQSSQPWKLPPHTIGAWWRFPLARWLPFVVNYARGRNALREKSERTFRGRKCFFVSPHKSREMKKIHQSFWQGLKTITIVL